jgi:hypothetical protein
MFLERDEFLLLQNSNPLSPAFVRSYSPNLEERKRFREAGIRTAIEYPSWRLTDVDVNKDCDYSHTMNLINTNREAGMKTICIVGGWELPDWIPDEWKARDKSGAYEKEVLSLWNDIAQKYSDLYYVKLLNECEADDVLFVFGEFQGGEGVYPSNAPLYDDAALYDYKRTFGNSAYPDMNNPETLEWYGKKATEYHFRKQKIFASQRHKEVWNMQQRLMDVWTKGFGNFTQREIIQRMREQFGNNMTITLGQFTYYDHEHYEIDNEQFIDGLVRDYNCQVLVEAHFCQGLKETTPKSIVKGFRGQIIGPTHEQSGYNHTEDWMFDEIRKSIELWKMTL